MATAITTAITTAVAQPSLEQSSAPPARSGWRTPLAWKNLTYDRRRLALALAGVGFAVLLMFMQFGFRAALIDSTVALPLKLKADIILVRQSRQTLLMHERFDRSLLYEAEGVPGVARVLPLYIETQRSNWRPNTIGAQALPIRTVAFDPALPIFDDQEINQLAPLLNQKNTVLFDALSKSDYEHPQKGAIAQHTGRQVRVVDLFHLGTDFATDATVLTSDRSFRDWFANPFSSDDPLDQIDLGLVQLTDKKHLTQALADLRARIPVHVAVKTKAEYVESEQKFWQNSTPVGYVFGFGTVLGFIVGAIICYQVLYADVTDHLPEYATLMAMGYRPRYFVSTVMQQAVLLSALAFIPASVAAVLLYGVLSFYTGLPLSMTPQRAVGVFALASAMCVVSGLFALRRLMSADPAELFR